MLKSADQLPKMDTGEKAGPVDDGVVAVDHIVRFAELGVQFIY